MAIKKVVTKADEGIVGVSPIIKLRGVSKYYGHVTALKDVDFTLLPTEIHALVGDNGSGKSTLINIISGAIQPSSGEFYVDGQRVHFTKPRDAFALGIATLYQDLALVDSRNIFENLYLGREPCHRFGFVDRQEMIRGAHEMVKSIKQMNITDIESKVSDLSGGQRQAVAIGRAMHWGSRVLLLDEPTAALGIREAHEVLNLIADLKTKGQTIIVVAHNLAHVFRVADRITVLRSGKLIGTVVKSDTNHDEVTKMITGADML
jgi:simple sugar transport system ATP-binding protein